MFLNLGRFGVGLGCILFLAVVRLVVSISANDCLERVWNDPYIITQKKKGEVLYRVGQMSTTVRPLKVYRTRSPKKDKNPFPSHMSSLGDADRIEKL